MRWCPLTHRQRRIRLGTRRQRKCLPIQLSWQSRPLKLACSGSVLTLDKPPQMAHPRAHLPAREGLARAIRSTAGRRVVAPRIRAATILDKVTAHVTMAVEEAISRWAHADITDAMSGPLSLLLSVKGLAKELTRRVGGGEIDGLQRVSLKSGSAAKGPHHVHWGWATRLTCTGGGRPAGWDYGK